MVGISILCMGLSLLLAGCEGEGTSYSGFTGMVAERRDARRSMSKKNAQKKGKAEGEAVKERKASTPSKGSNVIVRERMVNIVDASSEDHLGKGIAYLNKSGRIVRLKVLKK
ncbi:MAG: hypothetical protein MI747_15715 [Desulfobacterales bacterium]|nr:hypothetical protein [Desulfobacterales bacterium]